MLNQKVGANTLQFALYPVPMLSREQELSIRCRALREAAKVIWDNDVHPYTYLLRHIESLETELATLKAKEA